MTEKKIATYVSPRTNRDVAQGLCNQLPLTIKPVNVVEELFPLLSNPAYHTDFVVISAETFSNRLDHLDVFDIINTLHTLISSTVYRLDKNSKPQRRDTKIMIIVDEATDIKLIKELTSVPHVASLGWIVSRPEDIQKTKEHIDQVLAGNYAHDSRVLALLKPKKKTLPKNDKIELTTRQAQVLKLIQDRGCSNKHIAKILGVSESTVKLHMGAILKKYGVKNRTQLAVFSKDQP